MPSRGCPSNRLLLLAVAASLAICATADGSVAGLAANVHCVSERIQSGEGSSLTLWMGRATQAAIRMGFADSAIRSWKPKYWEPWALMDGWGLNEHLLVHDRRFNTRRSQVSVSVQNPIRDHLTNLPPPAKHI